jgi:hypothetical protein
MSSPARAQVFHRDLTPTEQLVAQALLEHGDFATGKNCRPSINRLAYYTGLDRSTIQRTLALFVKRRWFAKVEGNAATHAVSVYHLQLERMPVKPPFSRSTIARRTTRLGAQDGQAQSAPSLGALHTEARRTVRPNPNTYPIKPPREISQAEPADLPQHQLATELWDAIKLQLQNTTNPHSFATWWRPTYGAAIVGRLLLVKVPTAEFRHALLQPKFTSAITRPANIDGISYLTAGELDKLRDCPAELPDPILPVPVPIDYPNPTAYAPPPVAPPLRHIDTDPLPEIDNAAPPPSAKTPSAYQLRKLKLLDQQRERYS